MKVPPATSPTTFSCQAGTWHGWALTMVRSGSWRDQQIIPAEWVAESTRIHVPADKMNESEKSRIAGYSYLWWIPVVTKDRPEWEGAFVAAGHFGQFILCMPALDMVFVNRRAIPDHLAIARNDGSFKEELPAVTMEQFLNVARPVSRGRN